MPNDVLLLNADATPVTWLPISAISWQAAVRLIWLDHVDVLHTYEDWAVHSPSTTIEVPAVIILREHVSGFRRWIARDNSPQHHLIFLRDSFICQYCHKQFPERLLTVDHVKPSSFGGQTTYSNCTTACGSCNTKRGNNESIRPMNAPYRPTMGELIRNMRRFPLKIPHSSWNYYLQWDEHLVSIAKPKKGGSARDDNFDIIINDEVESVIN